MKNYYGQIGDIAITYDEIDRRGCFEYLPVYIERVKDDGAFDFAEGILPACTFQRTAGFAEDELDRLSRTLRNNSLLLWTLAKREEEERRVPETQSAL